MTRRNLGEGDVLVRVSHSTLNYKDGLAVSRGTPVVRALADDPRHRLRRHGGGEHASGLEAGRPRRSPPAGAWARPIWPATPSWPACRAAGWCACRTARRLAAGHGHRHRRLHRRAEPARPRTAGMDTPRGGPLLVTGAAGGVGLGGGRGGGQGQVGGDRQAPAGRRRRSTCATWAPPRSSTGPSFRPQQAAGPASGGRRLSTASAPTPWPTPWPRRAATAPVARLRPGPGHGPADDRDPVHPARPDPGGDQQRLRACFRCVARCGRVWRGASTAPLASMTRTPYRAVRGDALAPAILASEVRTHNRRNPLIQFTLDQTPAGPVHLGGRRCIGLQTVRPKFEAEGVAGRDSALATTQFI